MSDPRYALPRPLGSHDAELASALKTIQIASQCVRSLFGMDLPASEVDDLCGAAGRLEDEVHRLRQRARRSE